MSSSSNSPPSADGLGNVPEGCTSRFIKAGTVRHHVVTGGDGPPLLLVHGWPQDWFAWRLVMPALARDFQVIAVDQRGMGLSDKPQDGYDTATLANDLAALMDVLGHERFAVFGTDTGMNIAYALATDHADRVVRLVVSEALLLGVGPPTPLFVPPPLNDRLFHLMFNGLTVLNEQLVEGREHLFFRFEYDAWAARKLPDEAIKHYVDGFAASSDNLRGCFGFYRAADTTIAQNAERATRHLTMPVLAVGGELGIGELVADTMRLVANDVQGAVLPGSGHWIAEEAPDDLLAALAPFLAPYRDAAHAPSPRAAAVG